MSNETKTMSFEEFAGHLYSEGFYDLVFDEMHWSDGYSSSALLNMTAERAKRDEVTIADLETCDYDRWFFQTYKTTEKGLS